jgi:multidrug efflux system outer membrane protein
VIAAALVALLAACRTIDSTPPAVELPATTIESVPGIDRWWTQFRDPQLDALINEALAANLDLAIAVGRIEEARANLTVVRSFLYPTVDAYGTADRSRRSDATANRFPGPMVSNDFGAGLRASYEVDLWGKLSSGASAAASTLLATRYNAETVRTVLAAQVATTYFTLLALDAELKISRDTLETRIESVKLQKMRYNAGLIGEFDLRLAEGERAAVAASVPPLQRAIAQTEAALAVLAGRNARAVFTPAIARGSDLQTLTSPEVPAGLPSDILARRPDVRQSEAQLAAANARIAEARAQYFPALVLTGLYGSESAELSDLFSGPALVWSVAGSLLQPVFNAGRISAQVDAATARRQQVEAVYVQTVQSAFRDAHDALIAHRSARESYLLQEERREQFARALTLADARYRSGYVSYIDVLDTQRNLLEAERQRVLALRERQVALVDLYKALGGGWSPEQFTQAR